jgi:hypothetical protein
VLERQASLSVWGYIWQYLCVHTLSYCQDFQSSSTQLILQ